MLILSKWWSLQVPHTQQNPPTYGPSEEVTAGAMQKDVCRGLNICGFSFRAALPSLRARQQQTLSASAFRLLSSVFIIVKMNAKSFQTQCQKAGHFKNRLSPGRNTTDIGRAGASRWTHRLLVKGKLHLTLETVWAVCFLPLCLPIIHKTWSTPFFDANNEKHGVKV